MAILRLTTRAGVETTIESAQEKPLMRVIRDGGFDELMALCGGCCSCATCHVYVDPAFWDRLPPIGEDEAMMLECLDSRKEHSRLSCQVPFGDDLDGLGVTIAPEDA